MTTSRYTRPLSYDILKSGGRPTHLWTSCPTPTHVEMRPVTYTLSVRVSSLHCQEMAMVNDTLSNGTLNSTTTPANYVSFISYINQTHLSPFGLYNGEITMTSSYPRFSNNHNQFRRSFRPNTDQFKMGIVSTCPL